MIQNDQQFRRTRDALSHVEAALAALHRRKAEMHPSWYALMAEPILDELHRLRAQIDEYIGVPDATNAVAAAVGANGGDRPDAEP